MTQDLVERSVPIVGEPEHIERVLRVAHERGRLRTDPAEIQPRVLRSGKSMVKVRMLVPVKRAPITARVRESLAGWNPVALAIAKALAFAVACFLAVVAALLGIGMLLFKTGPFISGATVAAIMVAGLIIGLILVRKDDRACSGLHCSGCARH